MAKKKVTKFFMLLLINTVYSFSANAQSDITKVKFHVYKQLEDEVGFSHAVKVGNTLYISGITSSDTSMYTQIKDIMETIKNTLEKYGGTFRNIVKETVYTTDLDAFIANKELHKSYFKQDFPATTWVEVKRLYLPQFKVEIEVVAELK